MIFPSPREHCRPIYSGLSRRLTHICQPMGKVPWGSLLVFEDNKHLTLMTPAPKNPQRKLTVISKALKESAQLHTKITICWNEESFNCPGQPRGNTTPTNTPPTGFEPQLHIFYLKTFNSIYFAPSHPVLLVCNGKCPKIISTNFQSFVFGHPLSNNYTLAHDYFQLSAFIFMQAEADHHT